MGKVMWSTTSARTSVPGSSRVRPLHVAPDLPRKLGTPCIKKVLLSILNLVAREESYPGTCVYAQRERATAATEPAAVRADLKLHGIFFFFGNWDFQNHRISNIFFYRYHRGLKNFQRKFWTTSFTFPSHLPLFLQFYIQPSRPPLGLPTRLGYIGDAPRVALPHLP